MNNIWPANEGTGLSKTRLDGTLGLLHEKMTKDRLAALKAVGVDHCSLDACDKC